MSTLRLGSADLLRVRFATSPLWETVHAVRALVDPHLRAYHAPWLAGARAAAATLDLDPLLALHPHSGYVPDFLSPPPTSAAPRIEQQLRQVRRAPAARVEYELRRCQADQIDPRLRAVVDELLARPAAARDCLADLLGQAWQRLVEPSWPALDELIRRDIDHRSEQLAAHGLSRTLADLHPTVRWRDGAVVVRDRQHDRRDMDGCGLVLMPSAFAWPLVCLVIDPPWQPTIVYPARGIAELWRRPRVEPSAVVARLLGPTRARILGSLAEPSSTTALAARLDLSAGGVSAHLAVLRDAGLVLGARHRHEVRYRRTELGDAVLTGGRSADPAPDLRSADAAAAARSSAGPPARGAAAPRSAGRRLG